MAKEDWLKPWMLEPAYYVSKSVWELLKYATEKKKDAGALSEFLRSFRIEKQKSDTPESNVWTLTCINFGSMRVDCSDVARLRQYLHSIAHMQLSAFKMGCKSAQHGEDAKVGPIKCLKTDEKIIKITCLKDSKLDRAFGAALKLQKPPERE